MTDRPVTLDESYARCRVLNRRYGTTYYWSTFALPRRKQRHVHALYAFCRVADEIVDDPSWTSTADPAAALVVAAVAAREGREAWRGEACDCD